VGLRAGLKMFEEDLPRLGLEIRSVQSADYSLYRLRYLGRIYRLALLIRL
jgi:hypothetical protein